MNLCIFFEVFFVKYCAKFWCQKKIYEKSIFFDNFYFKFVSCY